MKHSKMAMANALALWAGIVWVICSVGVTVFPGLKLLIGWWFHLVDVSNVGRAVTMDGFLGGGITLMISAWLAGWLFGWCWELVSNKK